MLGPEMLMDLLCMHPESTAWPKGLPLLIIHGDHDTAVPFQETQRGFGKGTGRM